MHIIFKKKYINYSHAQLQENNKFCNFNDVSDNVLYISSVSLIYTHTDTFILHIEN